MPHTFFGISLGRYDAEDAIKTLAGQLDFLRTLRDLRTSDVCLIYRLRTADDGAGGMDATFSLLCVGRSKSALTAEEATSLHDAASVTLLPGWGLSRESAAPIPRAEHHVHLQPVNPHQPVSPFKPDPAPLVDLARWRNAPISIDWCCKAVAPGAERRTNGAPAPASSLATGRIDASFFMSSMSDSEDDGLLSVQLFVHSDANLDAALLASISHMALGRSTVASTAPRNMLFSKRLQMSSIIGTPDVLLPLFHPPHGHIQGRGLDKVGYANLPIRFHAADIEGTMLGLATRQDRKFDIPTPLQITDSDRLKHIYVLGKTGSGKSNLLKTLVKQDIENGRGVAVIDPHGDVADYSLEQCRDRMDEVTFLDFSDPTHVPMLNPLLLDATAVGGVDEVIEDLIDIICHRSFNQWTGPVFTDTAQMMFQTLRSSFVREKAGTPSVALGLRLLTAPVAERRTLAGKLEKDQPGLARQWVNFNNMDAGDNAEIIRWVEAKFTPWSESGALRSITAGDGSPLSFNEIVQERRILIAKLRTQDLGSAGSEIIGALLFSRLQRAAQLFPDPSNPFYLYVDEFQRFVGLDLESLVAESRKFGFGMVLAHQNLRQLDGFSRHEGTTTSRLREALFGNAGTMICMKTSGADVIPIAQELAISERSVHRIPQYGAIVRPVAGGIEREPATIRIPLAETRDQRRKTASAIRRQMIKRGAWQRRDRLEKGLGLALDAIGDSLVQPVRLPPASSAATAFKREQDRAVRKRRQTDAKANQSVPALDDTTKRRPTIGGGEHDDK